ncbi:MAG: HAMP domain-containing protein [Leptospiraceae bacterium]|nr:HAMP domain-containing protein [Leptospiraceae bacterium]
MIRQTISFKNAHKLAFRPDLALYFNHYNDAEWYRAEVEQLKANGVGRLYLLTSDSTSHQVEIMAGLRQFLDPASIELIEIPFRLLESAHFSEFWQHCQDIQHAVKNQSCLFLYSESKLEQVELFAAMFMLTLKSMRSIEPEYAIEYITGAKQQANLESVFHFKKFLSPHYVLPRELPGQLDSGILAESTESIDGADESPADASVPATKEETFALATAEPLNDAKETQSPPEIALPTAGPSPSNDQSQLANPGPVSAAPLQSKARPPAQSSGSERRPFLKSKFSIKVKLLSIITGIIVVALGSMAFIASGFFSAQTKLTVQENNLNLAQTIAGRVEKELANIGYKAHLMAQSIDQSIGTAAQRQLNIDLFFQNNKDFLFLGIVSERNQSFIFQSKLYNETAMQNLGLGRDNLDEIASANFEALAPALNGAFIVQNVSQGLTTPVLGIGLNLKPGTAVLVFMDPGQFLKSFKTRGVTAFMVNNKGDVIAHQDSKLVLTSTNLANLGIVKTMLESKSSNGLTQFEDQEGNGYLGSYVKLATGGLGIVTSIEEEKAFEAVSSIRQTNLIITLIIVSLSFIVVYFFAKSLSEPIKELADATGQIERGDYDIHIEPVTRDEVGFLTHSFGHMAVGLAERERAKDALTKFVNKQVAELALSGNINLGGETREAAVFFSDLRGFTAMSEKMTPEEVVSYLNEYFEGMIDAVIETHGIVDKFIGDAVMAHWGAFGSTGNNTENAINGALMMRGAIMAFNARGKGERPFAKQGCGINTGPVVSGQLGSTERFEFTVIGDTVNLASRIEALNKPFGTDILISQDSYDQVPGIYKVEAMPAITVKGKTEPQTIYAVVGRLDDPQCPENLDAVRDMLGIVFDKTKEINADAKEEKFAVVGEAK